MLILKLIARKYLNKLLNCPEFTFSNNSSQCSTNTRTLFLALMGELNVLVHENG